MPPLTVELAVHIRFERGLQLPYNRDSRPGDYENERLFYIAKRESEILEELARLDLELAMMEAKSLLKHTIETEAQSLLKQIVDKE